MALAARPAGQPRAPAHKFGPIVLLAVLMFTALAGVIYFTRNVDARSAAARQGGEPEPTHPTA